MRRWIFLGSAVSLFLAGLLLCMFGTANRVAVFIDGTPRILDTHALTVGAAVQAAGYKYTPDDRIIPPVSSLPPADGIIQVTSARTVDILIEPGGAHLSIFSSEPIPANLLMQAGLPLFPGDRLYLNGELLDPALPLTASGDITLQFRQAHELAISLPSGTVRVRSSAFTVSQALADAGVFLTRTDGSLPPLYASTDGIDSITVQSARSLQITAHGKLLSIRTNASTVGEALAEAGVPLQDLDRVSPAETDLLPADGRITITAVHEELTFSETLTPYGKEYVPDANTELDQTSVVTPGQYGISISRQRVHYEDDTEVSRRTEPPLVVSQPVDEQVGYGTKVVIRTLDTPNGPIEYWRAITVYATSYSPCQLGVTPPRCSYTAGPSHLPVQIGLIAVKSSWYYGSAMALQRLYVPGYGIGTIGDVGGGFPDGRYWIDLAYSDDNYVGWSQWVTVYFLTPVPAWYPAILP
jgi:uncharacterized protein YabE (DUF348 family)